MIDDGALKSRKLGAVSLGAGELFFRILLLADDNGNYPGDPLVIYVNGMRNKKCVTVEMVSELLEELIKIELLERYEVPEEDLPYIHVVNWHEHQKFQNDRPKKIEYPIHSKEPFFSETGMVPLRNQDGTIVDTKRKQDVPRPCPKRNPEVEVELEVESNKLTNNETEEGERLHIEPFPIFVKEFKQRAGCKTKPYPKVIHAYESAVMRYGYELLCQALTVWVEEEGGRDEIRADKKKSKFAMSNFLQDDLEQIVEEIKNPPVPEKSSGGYPVFKGHDQ